MSTAYRNRIKNLLILKKRDVISTEWLKLRGIPKKYLQMFGYERTTYEDAWRKSK